MQDELDREDLELMTRRLQREGKLRPSADAPAISPTKRLADPN